MAWFGKRKKITVAATSPKIFYGAVISLFSFLCQFDQDKKKLKFNFGHFLPDG